MSVGFQCISVKYFENMLEMPTSRYIILCSYIGPYNLHTPTVL